MTLDLDRLSHEVERDGLMAHLREFARRVKLSGTPEELESFRYLQGCMERYGYRTTLLHHDAYISLPGRSRVTVDGQVLRSITHSMSVPTGGRPCMAELVDVGDGSQAAMAARDVRGKIVLVEGIPFDHVVLAASRAGALGQLHVSPTQHLYEMCVSPVWGSPSSETRSALPTTAICTIDRDDGAALRRRLLAGEKLRVELDTEVDTGWRTTPLLVCDLAAGNDGADTPFVLLSGHHDTWHYGVMDNGAANATMLDCARILACHRESWRRDLRICFWSGHSHGRYSGSAWYADEYWDELDRRAAAHVNVDSTGGEGANELTQSGVIDELSHLAASEILAVSGQIHAGRRQGRAADQSFWGVGVPSMFGSLSHQPQGAVKMPIALGWWWHTPDDLLEHIDPDNLVRDTQIVLRVLARLLTDRVLPLDYGASAQSLGSELARLQAALGARFDIGPLRDATEQLKATAAALHARGHEVADDDARRIDQALMRVSRALVPINYTYGDRFLHDPAVPHPAWPSLEGLRALTRLDPGAAELPFFIVGARHARNRIAHALREAETALRSALAPR